MNVEAVAQHIPPGRLTLPLLESEEREKFAALSVRCGNCAHGMEKKRRAEHQVVFCGAHRIMVGTWCPRLCTRYAPE